jgi:hypothetical protein
VSSPPSDPVLDHPEVVARRTALRTAERQVEEARRALTAARDELAIAVNDAATPFRHGDEPIPFDSVGRLYWDLRELRVRDIASAFGLRATAIAGLAGPRSEDRSCDRCGAATVVHHPTRSAFDHRHRVPTRCASCQILEELERTLREEAWRRGHLDPHPDPWDPWDDEDPTGWEPRPLDR